ncbi:MAG: phage holin family protein [Kineosporiaceae bacterium]
MSGSERLDTPGVSVSNTGAASYGGAEREELTVEDSSLGEIVGKLAADFSRLTRAEIALAKAEAKEEAREAGKGVGLLAGAGVAGNLLLLFLSLAVMFGLGHWMALGWAALIAAVVWGVVAAVLASSGRSNLKRATPPMTETVETLKEDAQWAKRPRG